MIHVAHWDEVPAQRAEGGPVRADRHDLGRAAGMTASGVKRLRVDPGAAPAPAHAHGRDEEFFYVLGGSGLCWEDGVTHEIGPGDCVFHAAGGAAHTLVAGDEGLDALAFGPEAPTALTRLPRAGVFRAGPWLIADDAGPERPFAREPLEFEGTPGERPPTTIRAEEGVERVVRRGRTDVTYRDVGRAVGSVTTGLRWATIAAGMEGPPPHVHSTEDEIFVFLDGSGTVLLGDERFDVRRGSVVGRPAGTGVAHAFEAGADGLTYLAWSTREPSDLVFQPRSGKVLFRGLGIIARVERAEYWDGET